MPLYMDRHDIEGVTAQGVAEAVPPPIKWTLLPNGTEVSDERCQTVFGFDG